MASKCGTNLKLILNKLLVPNSSYLVCHHQNTKQLESVTFWANNLPLFDDDKTNRAINKNIGEEKTPPQIMLL